MSTSIENARDVTLVRQRLLDVSEHMDEYLPAPTVEAGWLLDASGLLGEQQREIQRLRGERGDGTQLRVILARLGSLLGRRTSSDSRPGGAE